jgi:hypothetical protein
VGKDKVVIDLTKKPEEDKLSAQAAPEETGTGSSGLGTTISSVGILVSSHFR